MVAEVLPSIFFIVFDPFLNFFLVVWVRSYINVQWHLFLTSIHRVHHIASA